MSGCSLFQVLRDLVVKNLSYTLVVVYLVFEVVTSGDGTGLEAGASMDWFVGHFVQWVLGSKFVRLTVFVDKHQICM